MSMRHVVLLRFVEGTQPAEVEAITAALSTLPGQIPELADYRVGPDLELADGTWDFGIVADFASVAHYEAYRDHPTHQQVIHDLIAPRVAERAAVQYVT
ncbi:MAG: Dabb family protein [Acidimicrobiales bacterium]|nr:Dabb family protein [Acidimicrobiales bacterium]